MESQKTYKFHFPMMIFPSKTVCWFWAPEEGRVEKENSNRRSFPFAVYPGHYATDLFLPHVTFPPPPAPPKKKIHNLLGVIGRKQWTNMEPTNWWLKNHSFSSAPFQVSSVGLGKNNYTRVIWFLCLFHWMLNKNCPFLFLKRQAKEQAMNQLMEVSQHVCGPHFAGG